MIVGFGMIMIAVGFLMCNLNMFIPLRLDTLLLLQSLQWMGIGLGFIGIIVIVGRSYQTGAGMWFDLPSRDKVILIHSGITGKRLDPNAKFVRAKDVGNGVLVAKKHIFKDTGGGFRICGHDVRRTHERLWAEIPEYLGKYLHTIFKKYKVDTSEKLMALWSELKNIHDPVPGMTVEDQLKRIKLLEPVQKDDRAWRELCSKTPDELRHMTEYLFTGETVHMEDVEKFLDLANPMDVDTWIRNEVNDKISESREYRGPGIQIDWNTWLPALGMFAFIAILGTVILLSYLD